MSDDQLQQSDDQLQQSDNLNQCAMSGRVAGEVRTFANQSGEVVKVTFTLAQGEGKQRFLVECSIPEAIAPARTLREGDWVMVMAKVFIRASGACGLRAYVVYKIAPPIN